MRAFLAVVLGYAAWTALWLGGNAGLRALFPDAWPAEGPYEAPLPLGLALALSVVCSLVAGALAGALARGRPVLALAVLLLLTGIGVQASLWEEMPLWYHLGFLALLVPVTLLGGRRGTRRG